MIHKQEEAAPQDTAANIRPVKRYSLAQRHCSTAEEPPATFTTETYTLSSHPAFVLLVSYCLRHIPPRWRPLEFLGLAIVIVHDRQGLQVTGLVDVWAQAQPADPQHLGVGVTAGQELQAHPAEADLRLLEQALTPRGQFFQLGENETGFPVGT